MPASRNLSEMAPPTFDLQAHSVASDGALEPGEVVARAHAAGVELLALTDHDTVAGVDEALEVAAATGGEITVVPAVEISAVDGEREDLHVLGYGINHRSPAFTAHLAAWREDRLARGERMAEAMRELGWHVELPERAADPGKPLGRPHLAQAIYDDPRNAQRVADENLGDFSELLVAYLIPGTPGYRRRTTPDVGEAIAAIHEAGGLAVWAHPFWDIDSPGEVREALERYAALELDGVEAFYPTHDAGHAAQLAADAAGLGLLTTGSADFHGPDHPQFSEFRAFELHGIEPNLGAIDPR